MKKITFLTVIAALFLVSGVAYGQELKHQEGPNGKYGYVDEKTGNLVIPYKYDYAGLYFFEGLAAVKLNGKIGYINTFDKMVIPCKYDDIIYAGNFSEGLIYVGLNGKYGFIDATDNMVIPCKYDGAGNFKEGLAPVKLNGKYGFIDKTGNIAIPYKYDYAYLHSFSDGIAIVEFNGKEGYTDIAGTFYKGKNNYKNQVKFRKIVAEKKARGEYATVLAQIENANAQIKQAREEKALLAQEQAAKERTAQTERENRARAEQAERERISRTFSFYAKNYVESKIATW
jgi:hypothetical protein